MRPKHTVALSHDQRERLDRLTRTGTHHARAIEHARALLLADSADEAPAWDDARIAVALGCSPATVARTRKRFLSGGIEAAIRVRAASTTPPLSKIDGRAEAHLVALACSAPPEGRARWTLRLLADRYVEAGLAGGWLGGPVSYETVRQRLKKTHSVRTVSSSG